MRGWMIAAVAAVPFSIVLWYVFEVNDWLAWALMGTAFWWRLIAPPQSR